MYQEGVFVKYVPRSYENRVVIEVIVVREFSRDDTMSVSTSSGRKSASKIMVGGVELYGTSIIAQPEEREKEKKEKKTDPQPN